MRDADWRRVEMVGRRLGEYHLQQYILCDPICHAAIDKALPTGALDSPCGLICGLLEVLEYAYAWHEFGGAILCE